MSRDQRLEQPGTGEIGELTGQVAAAVTAMMEKRSVPGLSLAVVDRDGPRLARGFGAADLSTPRTEATPSTAYLWFSMSKIVTATAALQLADHGRLDLDAPVGEYLDYLRAPGSVQPTVRQLLDHTSGLGNPLPIRWVHPAGGARPNPDVLLRRLTRRRRAYRHPPGLTARYSNVGYLALGQVLAAAAGMPFERYVHKSVLGPIGMRRTGYRYQAGIPSATGYVKAPRLADPLLRRMLPAGVAGNRNGHFLALNPFYVDGPAYGGLVGDVLDAGRFLTMHLNDGQVDGRQVLAPGTARRMRRIDHAGKPFDHGAGWFRRPTTGPGDWVEHFGAGAGFWNVMRIYPDRGLGVVIMTNSTTTYDFEPLMALLAGESWS